MRLYDVWRQVKSSILVNAVAFKFDSLDTHYLHPHSPLLTLHYPSVCLSACICVCMFVLCPVSTIPSPFFCCRFAVSVHRCRCRCRWRLKRSCASRFMGILLRATTYTTALNGKPITELRSVTCHMGSHSVTCHPTQVNAPRLNPSQTGRYGFTYPGGMEGWVDLGSLIAARLGIEPTTAWLQVRRPNRYAAKTHLFAVCGCNGSEFSYVSFTEQRFFTTADRRNGNGMVETGH